MHYAQVDLKATEMDAMKKLLMNLTLLCVVAQAVGEYTPHPLLQDNPLLFVTRRQYKQDHHNTVTIFQHKEINEKSYAPPGKIKLLNPKTGEVKTLVDPGPSGIARDPGIYLIDTLGNEELVYEELRRVEASFRQALREGDKLYDTDIQTITSAGEQP